MSRNNLADILSLKLSATKEAEVSFSGVQLYLESVATPIDVTFKDSNGATIGRAKQVRTGFNVTVPGTSSLIFKSSVAQTIRYAQAGESVSFNTVSGELSVTVKQANYTGESLFNVTAAGIQLTTVNPKVRQLIMTADPENTEPIYLGGNVSTLVTKSPIILKAGDTHIEDITAGAAWYARVAGATQKLRFRAAGDL